MSNLSKYEKETLILWNQTNDPITIQTYDPKFRHKLEDFARRFPELCKLEYCNELGGVFYKLEKSRFSYRLIAPFSEERRKQASEQAKLMASANQKTME